MFVTSFQWHDDAVRLHGTVDAGTEAAHHASRCAGPGSVARFKGVETGASFLEQRRSSIRLLEVVELVPFQSTAHSDGKNFDVGEERCEPRLELACFYYRVEIRLKLG